MIKNDMNEEIWPFSINGLQKFYLIPQVLTFYFIIHVLLGYYILILNFIFVIF